MSATPHTPRGFWVNSLLAVVLLLTAGLDVLLLGLVGWATWQRATLSERQFQMQKEDAVQLEASQLEARELRAFIASSREAAAATLEAFPSDADVARQVAGMHDIAATLGIAITELSPLATRSGTVPLRRFTVRAQGDWDSLCRFVTYIAQTFPSTCRLEELRLEGPGAQAKMSFELSIAVRPP
jgi:Tfp pilus assembly protein PilO